MRACLVSQARRDVSDLDFRRILSVFATESPSIRGWGFHYQELISYAWLPLRYPGPAGPSAHPNLKAYFCRAAYLYGMVEVVLPSRKQGKSGTCPRRFSTLPTYRVGTEEDSCSFLIPFDSQAKILKCAEKIRSRPLSSEELL